MKAIFTFIAAAGCLCSSQSFAGLMSAPFADASDYSIIVSGNANLGRGVHIHGGAYIYGDLTLSGDNMSVGSDSNTGLFVGGSILSNHRIDLMSNDYRVVGINAGYFQNAGTELTYSPVENVDVAAALRAKSSQLGALTDNGATVNDTDWNQVRVNLTADTLNVLNWDSSNASFLGSGNTNLLFDNFTDDTFVVINYTFEDAFTFAAKNQNLQSSMYDNVIWNFIGDSEVTVGNTVSTFKGSILAAQSNIDWQANDIDGQLLSGGLTWQNTSQSHYFVPWQDEPEVEVSEPTLLFLFPLMAVGFLRRRAD